MHETYERNPGDVFSDEEVKMIIKEASDISGLCQDHSQHNVYLWPLSRPNPQARTVSITASCSLSGRK